MRRPPRVRPRARPRCVRTLALARAPRTRRTETEADDSFANYLARFNATALGLGANSGGNSLWYSFDDGPIHWVFVHTEVRGVVIGVNAC